MAPTGNTSRLALRALVHPLSITAIVLLGVNDHLLKGLFPGVVTGKLSDVAGLAFFPLLVALGLSPLLRSPSRALAGSLLITGAWFSAVKTIPIAAAVTEGLLSPLFTWRIVVDPTDLVALPALGVALVAWRGAERGPRRPTDSPRTVASLELGMVVVAAVLSLATSCIDSAGVEVLGTDGSVLVAAERTPYGDRATSTDGGMTWTEWAEGSGSDKELESDSTGQDCFPEVPEHCFRIDGEALVEETTDGGSSWTVAWQLPAGREAFLERSGRGCDVYRVAAVDLLVTDASDPFVLVAMADDGLLRRHPDGTWERDVLGIAAPLADANAGIETEWFAGLAVALGAIPVLTLRAERVISGGSAAPMGVGRPLGLGLLTLAAALSAVRVSLSDPGYLGPVFSGGVFFVGLVGLAAVSDVWARLYSVRPRTTRAHGIVTAVGVVAVGAAVVAPFVAWSAGAIARWSTAGTVAGVAAVIVALTVREALSRIDRNEQAHPSRKASLTPADTATRARPWAAALLAIPAMWLTPTLGLFLLTGGAQWLLFLIIPGMATAYLAARLSGYRRPAAMTMLSVAVSFLPGLIGIYGRVALLLRPRHRRATVVRLVLVIPVVLASTTLTLGAWTLLAPMILTAVDWLTVHLATAADEPAPPDHDSHHQLHAGPPDAGSNPTRDPPPKR
jgi:hypothetical protein